MGKRGFSLVELMVVLGIIGLLTAVVMANAPAFRDRTRLDLTARDVAAAVRQAQMFGIGTRQVGGEFPPHGVYFNLVTLGKKTFRLYADTNSPGSGYDGSDSIVQTFTISGQMEIGRLEGCDPTSCGSIDPADILFTRPFPEPAFFASGGPYSYVKIVLRSTRSGEERAIEVWNTGFIAVSKI